MATIGIDFGTTYCRVAAISNGRIDVVQDAMGNRQISSVVAFTKEQQIIGQQAEIQLERDPKNSVFGAKRILGLAKDDIRGNHYAWAYNLQQGTGDLSRIQVKYKDRTLELLPEEISAMLLFQMKEIAEKHLDQKVENVVISVPVGFSVRQRRAIRDAGKIAGLDVLALINDTTAAAIAFHMENTTEQRRVLVIDLGGGCLDVSVLRTENDGINVIAAAGDHRTGGENFTERMVKHFSSDFTGNVNSRVMGRLRAACEKTKRALSLMTQAGKKKPVKIHISALLREGKVAKDFDESISRKKFEEINKDIFQRIQNLMVDTLKEAKLEPENIDDVVLIGGAIRMPKITKMMTTYFGSDKIRRSVSVEEAVVFGAARYAQTLIARNLSNPPLRVQDVSHSATYAEIISLNPNDDQPQAIQCIARNEELPAVCTHRFEWSGDLLVYEAKDDESQHAILSYHSQHFKFVFEMDIDGILCMQYSKDGRVTTHLLQTRKGNMKTEEIETIRQRIVKRQKEDEEWRSWVKNMDQLESEANATRRVVRKSQGLESDKKQALADCKSVLDWIENHRNNRTEETSRARERKVDEMHQIRVRFQNIFTSTSTQIKGTSFTTRQHIELTPRFDPKKISQQVRGNSRKPGGERDSSRHGSASERNSGGTPSYIHNSHRDTRRVPEAGYSDIGKSDASRSSSGRTWSGATSEFAPISGHNTHQAVSLPRQQSGSNQAWMRKSDSKPRRDRPGSFPSQSPHVQGFAVREHAEDDSDVGCFGRKRTKSTQTKN